MQICTDSPTGLSGFSPSQCIGSSSELRSREDQLESFTPNSGLYNKRPLMSHSCFIHLVLRYCQDPVMLKLQSRADMHVYVCGESGRSCGVGNHFHSYFLSASLSRVSIFDADILLFLWVRFFAFVFIFRNIFRSPS